MKLVCANTFVSVFCRRLHVKIRIQFYDAGGGEQMCLAWMYFFKIFSTVRKK